MRIGASHREVAILLVGALSRWVNHLEDTQLQSPRTKTLLKALRVYCHLPYHAYPTLIFCTPALGINLKLAIDSSLQLAQPDLIPSYLQTLIMSEGDSWVHKSINSVSLTLRQVPKEGKPVQTAGKAVRAFATRELSKAEGIAALED